MEATIIGIDPGLVHTGFVAISINESKRSITVTSKAFEAVTPDPDDDDPYLGPDLVEVHRLCQQFPAAHVFIEAYKPRSHYDTDPKMGRIINLMRRQIRTARTILNTGVLKVVTPEMMKMLQVWDYDTSTHHQDLRSAARIGLYGAMKDPALNRLLYDVISAELKRRGTYTIAKVEQ